MATGGATMLVSIVNYRTAGRVLDCLNSLKSEVGTIPGLRVIVVDNDSRDGSAEAIEAAIRHHGWHWATLARSPVNGGFAAGNNLAVRLGLESGPQPDLIWLLNPDTRVHPGAAASIVRFMAAHPRAGIMGTMIHEEDGAPWPFAFSFPTLLNEVERGVSLGLLSRLLGGRSGLRQMGTEPAQVEWVSGASMVVRRAVFDAVGPMDEGYFLYYEETDFCLRTAQAGWECWYAPDAAVTHIAGESTGATGRGSSARRVPSYWFESRRRYFIKNHGRAYAMATDLGWALAHLLWRLRTFALRRQPPQPPALLWDFLRHSALFHGFADARGR